jgi:hypothetical protein
MRPRAFFKVEENNFDFKTHKGTRGVEKKNPQNSRFF